MDERADTGVFQHPQRAIRTLFHIADSLPHIPALGRLGSAFTVKNDAIERLAAQAADEAAALRGPFEEIFLPTAKRGG